MPVKSKLRAERKIDLVKQCFKGELSISEASRLGAVSRMSIMRWLARFEAEGAPGVLSHERNYAYSPELKLQAVRDYLSGAGSLLEVSKKYGLRSPNQLRDW